MSSVIKGDLLRRIRMGGVHFVDPEQVNADTNCHADTGTPMSPDDTALATVERARAEAASLIAAAQVEAEAIRASARQDGYQAGIAELDQARADLEAGLSQAADDMERRLSDFWAEIEPQLLDLAVDIARKVVTHEIDADQEFVLDTVKFGLRQLRDRQELKIRVSPRDYDFVREHKDEISSACDGIRSLEIIDDRRVDAGGCVIESGNGHLDARISTQFAEVERALTEAAHDGKCDIAA